MCGFPERELASLSSRSSKPRPLLHRRVRRRPLVPHRVRRPGGGAGEGRRVRAAGVAAVPEVDRPAAQGGRQLPPRPARHHRRGALLPHAAPAHQDRLPPHAGQHLRPRPGRGRRDRLPGPLRLE